MRYIKLLVYLTACLCLLGSCSGEPEPIETDLSPAQMAAAIINSQDYEQDFILATPGQDIYELLVGASYAVPDGYITDGAICYLGGVEASEIAILSVDSEEHMTEVQACLSEYLLGRAASFTGYAPKQAAMAEAGVVESIGSYAVMLICENPAGARNAFLDCFDPEAQQNTDYTFVSVEHPKPSKDPKNNSNAADPTSTSTTVPGGDPKPVTPSVEPEPPVQTEPNEPVSPSEPTGPVPGDGQYNMDAILSINQSGDTSGLSDKDWAIYDKARSIIAQTISYDMLKWEKALTIHDWMTHNLEYDPDGLSNDPSAKVDPDSSIPYGPLVNGKAICEGYSTTYDLFMKLLGIDCVVVKGEVNDKHHNWNKVKLDDGNWYCVDVTWDDPIDAGPMNYYFCVSDSFFRNAGRTWEEPTPPTVDFGDYSRVNILQMLD